MDITSLIDKIEKIVERHYLGDGKYARFAFQDEKCTRNMGVNEYGCADALNILYTICRFPTGKKREDCMNVLLNMQDKDSGLFIEQKGENFGGYVHHPVHTTAHCMAALDLFDAAPLYKPTALNQYFTKEGLTSLLDSLDWEGNPWPQSHQGAGIFVIGELSDSVTEEWREHYFKTLYDFTDSEFGISRSGSHGKSPLYNHLNGWFHYTFNTEYAHQPMRYPEKIIDTCIDMFRNRGKDTHPKMCHEVGFVEIDWIYVINRATRQTPHRFYEAKEAIRDFAREHIEYLESLDPDTDDGLNDLHMLFGTVCALAELQAALPGEIKTRRPLRLVLDRRPFI